ncbi:ABC transporter substrate-binding protein [Halococcus sp. AFM35]|uniref:ABC transporter substrate-binding protein n=1 Tax=Halococcus sp. AFM35 TaxID=3421653 RepID=UPI003EC0ED4E
MARDTNTGTTLKGISRRQFLAATGTASTVTIAGCLSGSGGGGGNGSGSSNGNGSTSSSVPSKPDKLTVRAWGGSWQKSLKNAVAKPFTNKTGIDIGFDNSSEEVMQGKIRTALRQDRTPPVNVNWSTTPLTYKSFQAGLMSPLDPKVVTHLSQLLPPAKPNTGDMAWPFTSLYSYVYTLSYNTNILSSSPSSWTDLWSDKWKNSIGLYQNGTGTTPVVAKLVDEKLDGDMTEVWNRYRKLKPNVGVIGDDTQLTQNLRTGEISMAALIVSNAYNVKKQGAPVDYLVPEEGAVAKRDAMWIPKNQQDKYTYWGQKFIDYAIRKENIGEWGRKLGVAPLNPNANIPQSMAKQTAFPTTQKQFNNLITVKPANYVENSSYWFSQFNQIMKK